ncbi:MAG: acetylxylan esterase [Candidatus Azobacteroides sp.]|nr:acetylxylan esterase [Candidatus Azobacteroides sp.]
MKKSIFFAIALLVSATVSAQSRIKNDSINYLISNSLISENGTEIKTVQQWENIRRPELYKLFEQQEYGEVPDGIKVRFREIYSSSGYLQGKATIREFEMLINDDPEPQMHILFFIPNSIKGKIPAIMGYNWNGNQSLCTDTSVFMIPQEQIEKRVAPNRLKSTLNQSKRGTDHDTPIEKIIDSGYAYITACYWELEPDNLNPYSVGIRALLNEGKPFAANQWGAIAAWAWGMSRMLDCSEQVQEIDITRCAIVGHSRLGKAALWAGVRDERFAIVISNHSGCGGAALSKRISGETVEIINTQFPYWFCENFRQYNGKEDNLPMDQHQLLALVAPRPLYVCSGVEDLWADPLGEYLSVVYANPVYQLYGKQPMPFTGNFLPPANTPQIGDIAYHVENGGHQFSAYDWEQYLLFFDKYLKVK